ncbi:MAG TPA: sigma-70 family RNA polymerase sigma factor, partial [Phenylobacterium sp.]|nr:sigma-70 family RNA polymerase sigma factor [Phenylobacterium sp.]
RDNIGYFPRVGHIAGFAPRGAARQMGGAALAASGPSERRAENDPLIRAFFEKRENLVLFLAARTRSMAAAEDLVQDLYVRLATQPMASEVKSPTALLYRMAANLLVDQVRSEQRSSRRSAQWRTETRATLGGEDVVEETPADEALIARERVRQLAAAVEDLPTQMGRAFRLHKLEGRSQAETAEAMGVSRKMVEAHIQAAVRHLSKRLRS